MLQTFSKLADVVAYYDGILLDACGVFWNGSVRGLAPGSKETMASFVSQGKIVGVLSNSTQFASEQKTKFKKHGLIEGQHYYFVMTSGQKLRELVLEDRLPFPTKSKKYMLSRPEYPGYVSPEHLFEGSCFAKTESDAEANFIYIC